MKQVFEHIAARSAEYAENPMFLYLRDSHVDSRKRLEFVPWISHFVMTFADLYNSFLIEEPAPGDRFQELVNTHLDEESTHWKWFLTDLDTMGLNPTLRFTDALRLLWGSETRKTRALAYEVCKLSSGLSSLEKLVLVHAIEATGRVALEALVPVGVEFGTESGRRLVYFGQHHLDTERQHTVEEDGTRKFLEGVPVDGPQLARLCGIVDDVFKHFSTFADEAFARANSTRSFPNAAMERQQRASA
jgi:hypothetical protein